MSVISRLRTITLIGIAMIQFACQSANQTEIARLSIEKLSTSTFMNESKTALELKQGSTIQLWCDLQMNYKSEVELQYKITVKKNDQGFKGFAFDPRKIQNKTMDKKTTKGDTTFWHIEGLGAEFTVPETASYEFLAALVINNNQTFRAPTSELVIKK